MAKKKNYLDSEELKQEILKCITKGYDHAVSFGFDSTVKPFESNDPEEIKKHNKLLELGYMPERSQWIKDLKVYDKNKVKSLVNCGDLSSEEALKLEKQMEKPVASDKLAKMFQLIVENVSRSFYWANPDDGFDCKANAILDLCSNFWKFEPVDSKGKSYNAFAFCTQIAYFGIAGAHRILHPKKYMGTISMSCLDENGKTFDLYNI